MDEKSAPSPIVFGDELEKRVWVATFEVECKREGSSVIASSCADAQVNYYRRRTAIGYANESTLAGEEAPNASP